MCRSTREEPHSCDSESIASSVACKLVQIHDFKMIMSKSARNTIKRIKIIMTIDGITSLYMLSGFRSTV